MKLRTCFWSGAVVWASLGLANAEPVTEGALAGTFALRVEISHVVELPLLPDRVNEGINILLVQREYIGDGKYSQTSRMCSVRNGSVMGSGVQVRDKALKNLPPIHETILLDSATGRYSSREHVQIWGLKPVPEAYSAAFPTSLEQVKNPPYSDWVFDMDEDGQIGVSMQATGLASGELQGIQRKAFRLEGMALSKDRVLGLASMTKESLVLSSTSRVLKPGRYTKGESSSDTSASFFEEIRLENGANCDAVRALVVAEAFLEDSPF
jgi:hypothetical protein